MEDLLNDEIKPIQTFISLNDPFGTKIYVHLTNFPSAVTVFLNSSSSSISDIESNLLSLSQLTSSIPTNPQTYPNSSPSNPRGYARLGSLVCAIAQRDDYTLQEQSSITRSSQSSTVKSTLKREIVTTSFLNDPTTIDFAKRVASTLASRLNKVVFVGSSVIFQGVGKHYDTDEELKGFKQLINLLNQLILTSSP